MRIWDRLMGRSVVDLAQEVDEALAALAEARGRMFEFQHAADLATEDVRQAERRVQEARDALFKEHPDLAPGSPMPTDIDTKEPTVPVPPNHSSLLPGQDPSKFEVVEVDDDNDPRFTSGVTISAKEDDPLPPVVWEENDD